MAGVKGKSGGARPNTGGARPGAGRKPKPAPKVEIPASADSHDPLKFLEAIMTDNAVDARLRLEAAKVLMPFVHRKKGDAGKKGEKEKAALAAAAGRFKSAMPPKLVVNNR